MATTGDIFSFKNPLTFTYIVYVSILVLKMLLMSVLTAKQRLAKRAFANPEDAKGMGKVRVDDDVERVRRAHLNDLENIPVFMVVSGLYLLTNPSVWLATTLFRTYTIARVLHTLVYAVVVIPQPARGLSWGIGYGITIYMAVKTLLSFASGL